jgi:hypothetical protein
MAAVLLSGLAVFASNFVLAAAWHWLIERVTGRKLGWQAQLRTFMASNLGRYVPGKLALPAVRIGALGALGVSPAAVGGAMVLELLSWVASSGVVAFTLLSFGPSDVLCAAVGLPPRFGSMAFAVLLGLSVLLSCLLVLVDGRRLPAIFLRLSGLQQSGPLVSPYVFLAHTSYWACWWVHGFLLVQGFGASFMPAMTAGAAFVLGPVLGFLALIAPAGAGVKEAVVIALVSPVTGISNGVVIGVLSRVLSLLADVSGWLISLVICRLWRDASGTPRAERLV